MKRIAASAVFLLALASASVSLANDSTTPPATQPAATIQPAPTPATYPTYRVMSPCPECA